MDLNVITVGPRAVAVCIPHRRVRLSNIGYPTIYLGNDDVNPTTGLPIRPNTPAQIFEPDDVLYAVVPASDAVVAGLLAVMVEGAAS